MKETTTLVTVFFLFVQYGWRNDKETRLPFGKIWPNPTGGFRLLMHLKQELAPALHAQKKAASHQERWIGHSYINDMVYMLIAWQTTMTDLKRVFVEGKKHCMSLHVHSLTCSCIVWWKPYIVHVVEDLFWPCESEEGTRSFDQCPKTICNLPWCKPARIHSISRSTARYHKVKQANLGINTCMMSVKIPHQHRLPSEMEKYFLSSFHSLLSSIYRQTYFNHRIYAI